MANSKGTLISIITPTYNHAKYIEACINSVQAQTFSQWELIIIDDDSNDNNLQIIHSCANNDNRIKVLHQNHLGIYKLNETYNKALKDSIGEYIAILEGDDLWESNKLQLQVNIALRNPECVLIWGRASSLIGSSNKIYETHPKCEKINYRYYFNQPLTSFFNIVFDDFPPPLTFLIKKSALLKIGGFKQILPFPAVDLPTILALSKIGPFYFIPERLGFWRQHPYQITKSNSKQIVEGSAKIIMDHYETLTPEQKIFLKFDRQFIERNTQERIVISYSRSGRFKLIKKEFKEARRDYFKAIFFMPINIAPVWRIRAIIGLIFSLLHLNVEGFARFLGKVSYK